MIMSRYHFRFVNSWQTDDKKSYFYFQSKKCSANKDELIMYTYTQNNFQILESIYKYSQHKQLVAIQ